MTDDRFSRQAKADLRTAGGIFMTAGVGFTFALALNALFGFPSGVIGFIIFIGIVLYAVGADTGGDGE